MRKEGKTKEAPASELELLRQRISQLETSEAKRRQGEEAANMLIHDLRERVKELSCLYRISDFAGKEDISLERILEQTVNLIPAAWQYPQITCVRIILDGREFRTENFRETTWKLLRDIIVHGYPAGTVEVCYLEEKPKSDEGPFLKEEGELISAIAKQLGEITRRKQMEEEIQESETRYRLLAENATDVIWTVGMNMRPTYISPSVTNLLGYSVEEAMAKTQEEVYTPGSHELATKVLAEELAMENRGDKDLSMSRTLQLDLNRKDGSVVTAEVKFTFLRDLEGHPVEILAMARDITERKREEEILRESEKKYRLLAENVTDIIWTMDMDLRFTYVSPSVTRLSGFSTEEATTHTVQDVLTPSSLAIAMKAVEEEIAREKMEEKDITRSRMLELELRCKDSSTMWTEMTITALRDQNGRPVEFVGIARDITERKQAEDTLRESEEKYRDLTENINDTIYAVDEDGNVTYVSPVIESCLGYIPSEIIGRSFAEFLHQEDLPRAAESFQRTLSGQTTAEEYRFWTKSGEMRWMFTSNRSTFDGDRVVGARGVLTDITERKRVEDELRKAEERYRTILDSVEDGYFEVDLAGNFTFVSDAACRMSGYSREEMMGTGYRTYAPEKDIKAAYEAFNRVYRTGKPMQDFHGEIFRKDGAKRFLGTSASPIRDSGGEITGFRGVMRDVTERMKTEQALKESEERYRLLAENVTDVIWTMDMNLRYTYMSPSITRQRAYSVEEAMAQPVEETMTPASLEVAAKALLDDLAPENATERGPSRPHTLELELYCKDGSTIWAEMTVSILRDSDGQPVGILGITREITERKRAEEARMEQTLALTRAEELQQSRQRIVTTQESLRKEIAHQIHGTVQNRLIILLHRLAAVGRTAPRGKLAAELEEMRQTLENLLEQDVRLISQRLYPSILRQGLLPALQSLGDQFEAVMPVAIQLDEELMQQERTNRQFIPEQVRLAAYRIAEEALTNVAKHAKASRVTMGLELSSDGWLHLRVQDNGQGFDVESTYGGRDLLMMQDYAEVAGGRCVIRSVLGEGTKVTATLPLAKPGAEHPETVSPLE